MFYFAAYTQTGSGTNTAVPFPLQEEDGLYYTDENKDAGIVNPAPYYNTGQEIYILKLSPEGVPVWGSFVGGQGAHVQPDYYQGGGDVLCALQVRNDRVFIGGCTNSFNAFPFAGTVPAYIDGSPPDPFVIDGPNVWNGFIMNLSEQLNFDVGMPGSEPLDHDWSVFPSPTEDYLTLLSADGRDLERSVVVFDATGREVLRLAGLRSTGGRLPLNVESLAPGLYTGSVSGFTNGRFTFIKR